MNVKEEREKVGLKLSIQKMKIMVSGPITSCHIDGEKVEAVTDFIFLGCKITVDSDCSHKIKRPLLPGRKAMTNLDNMTLRTPSSQSYGFSSSYYGCDSWTIKTAEW